MTDIDFEELDRAVQSAIDDFSEESSPSTVEPSPAVSEEPVASSLEPAPKKQFFSNPRPAANRPVSKQNTRSLDSFSSANSSVELTPTVKREKVVPEAKRGPIIDVVNPLKRNPVKELRNHTAEPTIAPIIEPAEEPTPEIFDPIAVELEEKIKESPFIDNLKVDKRPLGAFSTESNDKKVELPEEPKAPVETPTYIGGVDEASELPAELQQDVLAIESTGMIHEQEPLSDENVGLKEATKNTQALANALNEDSKTKTENVNTEETVYTSEAYTKPLAHPQKKKTGWFSVVLIVLLLIVGVAAGAAIYYLKLF